MIDSRIGKIGQLVISRGLNDAVAGNKETAREVYGALDRYLSGDWGDLQEEDKVLNNKAVADPGSDRILARYNLNCGDIYIITEWDRSYTTLMYCNEY